MELPEGKPVVESRDHSDADLPSGVHGPRDVPGRWLATSIAVLGFSATVSQLVLMRELLCVLAGNELILGVILGAWFLLTGMGAALGRSAARLRRPVAVLTAAQVLVAILPVASVVALRLLRNEAFTRGEEIGPIASVVTSLLVLLPYCLVSGYVLTLVCGMARRASDACVARAIGSVYAWDVLGGIAGAAAFTFLLVHVLSDLAALYVPAGASLAMAAALSLRLRRWAWAVGVCIVAAGGAAAAAAVDWNGVSARAAMGGQNIVYDGSGPYGRLVVTRDGGQHTFFHNGVPLFTTNDTERIETVHLAMAQRTGARAVLLLCGGLSGTAGEVLKYPAVETVVAAEINPRAIEGARRFLPGGLTDRRLRLENADGRVLLRRGQERFDVIVSDAPDPSTAQINRFFTAEFVAEAKARLRAGGVLGVSIGTYANYIGPQTTEMLATMRQTLLTAFANVLVLPGERVMLLASDGSLSGEIGPAMQRAGVKAKWVTPQFDTTVLTPDRLQTVGAAAAGPAEVNRDFAPRLYDLHLRHWLSRYRGPLDWLWQALLVGSLLAAIVVVLLRSGLVGTAVFATGFAASALEVVILLGYQVAHGSLYEGLGLIVMAFMAGLAGGVVWANRRRARRPARALAAVTAAVAVLGALLPAAVWALTRPAGPAGAALSAYGAFPLLTAVLGGLVGAAFPLAAAAAPAATATVTAGRLYAADYVGGCAGALVVSTLLIPLLGVPAACGIIAALNAGAAALVFVRR